MRYKKRRAATCSGSDVEDEVLPSQHRKRAIDAMEGRLANLAGEVSSLQNQLEDLRKLQGELAAEGDMLQARLQGLPEDVKANRLSDAQALGSGSTRGSDPGSTFHFSMLTRGEPSSPGGHVSAERQLPPSSFCCKALEGRSPDRHLDQMAQAPSLAVDPWDEIMLTNYHDDCPDVDMGAASSEGAVQVVAAGSTTGSPATGLNTPAALNPPAPARLSTSRLPGSRAPAGLHLKNQPSVAYSSAALSSTTPAVAIVGADGVGPRCLPGLVGYPTVMTAAAAGPLGDTMNGEGGLEAIAVAGGMGEALWWQQQPEFPAHQYPDSFPYHPQQQQQQQQQQQLQTQLNEQRPLYHHMAPLPPLTPTGAPALLPPATASHQLTSPRPLRCRQLQQQQPHLQLTLQQQLQSCSPRGVFDDASTRGRQGRWAATFGPLQPDPADASPLGCGAAGEGAAAASDAAAAAGPTSDMGLMPAATAAVGSWLNAAAAGRAITGVSLVSAAAASSSSSTAGQQRAAAGPLGGQMMMNPDRGGSSARHRGGSVTGGVSAAASSLRTGTVMDNSAIMGVSFGAGGDGGRGFSGSAGLKGTVTRAGKGYSGGGGPAAAAAALLHDAGMAIPVATGFCMGGLGSGPLDLGAPTVGGGRGGGAAGGPPVSRQSVSSLAEGLLVPSLKQQTLSMQDVQQDEQQHLLQMQVQMQGQQVQHQHLQNFVEQHQQRAQSSQEQQQLQAAGVSCGGGCGGTTRIPAAGTSHGRLQRHGASWCSGGDGSNGAQGAGAACTATGGEAAAAAGVALGAVVLSGSVDQQSIAGEQQLQQQQHSSSWLVGDGGGKHGGGGNSIAAAAAVAPPPMAGGVQAVDSKSGAAHLAAAGAAAAAEGVSAPPGLAGTPSAPRLSRGLCGEDALWGGELQQQIPLARSRSGCNGSAAAAAAGTLPLPLPCPTVSPWHVQSWPTSYGSSPGPYAQPYGSSYPVPMRYGGAPAGRSATWRRVPVRQPALPHIPPPLPLPGPMGGGSPPPPSLPMAPPGTALGVCAPKFLHGTALSSSSGLLSPPPGPPPTPLQEQADVCPSGAHGAAATADIPTDATAADADGTVAVGAEAAATASPPATGMAGPRLPATTAYSAGSHVPGLPYCNAASPD